MTEPEPKWYGPDEPAAISQARREGGCVIYSVAPGQTIYGSGLAAEWGYWWEPPDMTPLLRPGEQITYPPE